MRAPMDHCDADSYARAIARAQAIPAGPPPTITIWAPSADGLVFERFAKGDWIHWDWPSRLRSTLDSLW